VWTGLLHYSHKLMPKGLTWLHPWDCAVIKVQVRATNGGGCDTQDNVLWMLDDRLRLIVYTYIHWPVPN
jgi:hypothetical protein